MDAVCSKQNKSRTAADAFAGHRVYQRGERKLFVMLHEAIDPLDGRTRKDGSIGFTKD